MTITVGWTTDQVIRVNKVDMTLVQSTPVEVYELNVNTFFLALKDLEHGVDGMPWTDTQRNNSPVTLGGITYARVLEIIDPYTITFEDGQYVVDLVGANSNILDRTNPNQVSVRGNNSAGLVGTRTLENLSFTDARIWIDTNTGVPGTTFPPIGTPADPSNNFADASTIQTNRSMPPRFHLSGSLSFGATDNVDDHDFLADSPDRAAINFTAGCSTAGILLENIAVTGTLSGDAVLRNCSLDGISGLEGEVEDCGLLNTITIDAAATELVHLHRCHSEMPGTARPILDINGAIADVLIDRWTGGIELRNLTQGQSVTLNVAAGSVRIHPSCTNATVKIRGDVSIENNATGNPSLTLLVYENNEKSKWERIASIHTRLGLNADDPITDTPAGIDSASGAIDINRTGDGVTSSTLTRQ